jgi:hypothetical protein
MTQGTASLRAEVCLRVNYRLYLWAIFGQIWAIYMAQMNTNNKPGTPLNPFFPKETVPAMGLFQVGKEWLAL